MGNTTLSASKPDGVIARRLSEVIVRRSGYREWIAVGRQAADVGETLIVEIDEGEGREEVEMHVIESRPLMVDGDTRHRIRLLMTDLPVLFEQQIRRG